MHHRRAIHFHHDEIEFSDAIEAMESAWRDVTGGGDMVVFTLVHARPVITLGRHAKVSDIVDESALVARGAHVFRTDRGGGATAHGPGQVVLYPVVDLKRVAHSIPSFTHVLLDAARATLSAFGVTAHQGENGTGLFVNGADGDKKIASVGLRSRRHVVTHGLSLNVNNDLTLFDCIATCGQERRAVTSICQGRGMHQSRDPGQNNLQIRDVADRLACEMGERLMLEWQQK